MESNRATVIRFVKAVNDHDVNDVDGREPVLKNINCRFT